MDNTKYKIAQDKTLVQVTIMIVDDTPQNLTVLSNILSEQGYRVVAFPRGEMALKAARENPPDIILLDIRMPGMDGFEVCRRLKEDELLKDVPVLFISALGDTKTKIMAFSAGGVDYIEKPFNPKEVLARVETHLKLRRLQIELENYSHNLEELVQKKVKEISNSQIATIHALANLAEHRDDETGQHIERTKAFCKLLAERLSHRSEFSKIINKTFIKTIEMAAPLHDIGKVGIPDNILLKPGRLTPEEFEIMKTHTIIGANTLEEVCKRYPHNAFINMGINIARYHHEKWNGKGYPKGLSGDEIPLCARIMALADVYDALRSKRPYKEPFSHEKSFKIIIEESEGHFDPRIVEVFKTLSDDVARIREQMDDDPTP